MRPTWHCLCQNRYKSTDPHSCPFLFGLFVHLFLDDIEVSKRFGIEYDELPTLVYFEEKIPNFYQGKYGHYWSIKFAGLKQWSHWIAGDLMNEEEVLEWLIHQKNTDEIEDVSDAVLENMIDSTNYLAVLFCE